LEEACLMGFSGGKTQGKLEAALLGLFEILIPINSFAVNPKTG
jgi:hypothetical protein